LLTEKNKNKRSLGIFGVAILMLTSVFSVLTSYFAVLILGLRAALLLRSKYAKFAVYSTQAVVNSIDDYEYKNLQSFQRLLPVQ
jgi:hypothetical protein